MMSELSRADIAARLGLTEQRISQLSATDGFPPPTRTRHGKRWRLADVEVWERRHRSKVPELYDVSDIAEWFAPSWPMGGEPHRRILYLLQGHLVPATAEHHGHALYGIETVRRLWSMLTEIRPSEERIQAEAEAVERYRMSGIPTVADCAESSYWLKQHENDGSNMGGLVTEAGEPPTLPARPVPEVDEGENE